MREQREGRGGARRGDRTEGWSAIRRVRTDRQRCHQHTDEKSNQKYDSEEPGCWEQPRHSGGGCLPSIQARKLVRL